MPVTASPKLENLWQKVLTQYGEKSIHEHFVQECLRDKKLHYASYRYKTMLENSPHDEMAKAMMNHIIQVATHNVQLETQQSPPAQGILSGFAYTACFFLIGLILLAPQYAKVVLGYTAGVTGLTFLGVIFLKMMRR